MSTPQDAKLMESLSLLVIEDSSFVRKVIKTALASFHVRQIIEAEDAVAGLEILWNMGDNIDVILLDREMPVLDGIEFAKLVRRDKGLPNMNIPIVMISGHVDRAKVLEAQNAGIDGFLAKPFSPNDLKERIVFTLNKKTGQG